MKVYNLLTVDELRPLQSPEVSVKAFSKRYCAEREMKFRFENKKRELINGEYDLIKEAPYAPDCDRNGAVLSIRTTDGIGEITWAISEQEIEAVISVETPLGQLKAVGVSDPDHPGIDISLDMKNSCVPLALVEFSKDEADRSEASIITRVWGNCYEDEYTDRRIHRLPVVIDCTDTGTDECKLAEYEEKVFLLDAGAPIVCPENDNIFLTVFREKPNVFRAEEKYQVMRTLGFDLIPSEKNE